MSIRRRIQIFAALVALAPFVLPPHLVLADGPSNRPHLGRPAAGSHSGRQPTALDIELGNDGVLSGQIVSETGQAIANEPLRLLHRGRLVAESSSGHDGAFRFMGVRGGVHQIATAKGAIVVRCWQANTAPPAAEPGVLLVSDGKTLRGQHPISHLFTNPVIVGLAIAAAIAIPIIINNSDSGSSSP